MRALFVNSHRGKNNAHEKTRRVTDDSSLYDKPSVPLTWFTMSKRKAGEIFWKTGGIGWR